MRLVQDRPGAGTGGADADPFHDDQRGRDQLQDRPSGRLIRCLDAAYLNPIINDPSIRPHIGGDPSIPLDLTSLVADHKNYMLIGAHGGFAYTWTAPETYEVHTFILPEGRGPAAYRLAKQSLDYMAKVGATHIWTRVERGAENVKRFTLAAGFKPCGDQVLDLGAGPVTYDLFSWRPGCQ